MKKELKGLDVYGEVRMFHKNEWGDFWDALLIVLDESEVTNRDKRRIGVLINEAEDILYKIEKILVKEKYV